MIMADEKSPYQRFFPDQFTLETPLVLLRLVKPEDYEILKTLSRPKEIFTWFSKDLSDEAELKKWFDGIFRERKQETRASFTVIDKHTNEVVGSTSYLN